MQKTKIEWAQMSWNPIVGCKPISAGCLHCYAARMAGTRLRHTDKYKGLARNNCWTGAIRFQEKELAAVNKKTPGTVFVCSMADLFYEVIPDRFIRQIFDAMIRNPQHRYFVLTKRPLRMRDFILQEYGEPFGELCGFIALGVTTEHQRAAEQRIPILLNTPARFHYVSAEPLLTPLDLSFCSANLDGVIAGAETGPGARAAKPNWFRFLRDQCNQENVPFCLKQINAKRERRLDGVTWNGSVWRTPDVVKVVEMIRRDAEYRRIGRE